MNNLILNSHLQNTLCWKGNLRVFFVIFICCPAGSQRYKIKVKKLKSCLLRLKFYTIISILHHIKYVQRWYKQWWSLGCSDAAALRHASSVDSVFCSSHDMRALERVRQEVFLCCCCQPCLRFFQTSLYPLLFFVPVMAVWSLRVNAGK